jgi:DNA-directed RNA polymerase subunit RPC12/RpoP
MEVLHERRLERGYTPSPALNCPYCGQRAPARIKRKISVGGWIWFAVWFVIFLCFMWAPTTAANLSNMEKSAFFCLGVGIVGLFVIRKRTYACGHCGAKITDA